MLVSATDTHNNILISHQKSKANAVSFKQQNIVGCVQVTAGAETRLLPLTRSSAASQKNTTKHR